MRKIYAALVLLFALMSAGHGQSRQLAFEHLSQFNGLENGAVLDVFQDKRGYIWVGNYFTVTRYDGYQTKIFRTANKYESAMKIIADSHQDLWMLTSLGNIYKYDIARDSLVMQDIRIPKLKDYSSGYYVSFYFDHDDNLYILSDIINKDKHDEQVVYKYDHLTHHVTKLDIKALQISDGEGSLVSSSGDLLFPTKNGLFQYQQAIKKMRSWFSSADSTKSKGVKFIYEPANQKGKLWLLIKSPADKNKTELWHFDLKKQKADFCFAVGDSLKTSNGYGVYTDKKQQLWIVLTNCIYRYHPDSKKLDTYPIPKTFRTEGEYTYLGKMVEDRDGIFWFPYLGLVSFNPQTGKFEQYLANRSVPTALAHSHVVKVMLDRTGLLWIAMDDYGLDRVNLLGSAVKTYINNSENPRSFPELLSDIVSDHHGNYYLTAQLGVFKWKYLSGEFNRVELPYKKRSSDDIYNGVGVKSDGTICYFTKAGLNIYLPGKAARLIPMADPSFVLPVPDATDTLWASSGSKGVAKVNEADGKLTYYPLADFTGKLLPPAKTGNGGRISIGRDGHIWVINLVNGLFLINKSLKIAQAITNDTRSKKLLKEVLDVYETSTGRVWIGTKENGLLEFDLAKHVVTKIVKQGATGYAYGITEDKAGNLWIGNDKIISKYNPATGRLESFSSANNIPFDEFFKMVKDPSGNIIYGMRNSMFVFNPLEITSNQFSPQLSIESIVYTDPRLSLNGTTLSAIDLQKLELPYNQNRVTFNYTALHFINPALNQYQYQLDGYDKQWIRAGTQRSVTYNNLSPGTYTFKMKASNSDGIWNNNPIIFKLTIEAPWWGRWWAWMLYMLTGAGAIYAIIHYRSLRLRRENQHLEEKVNLRTKQLSRANDDLEGTLKTLKTTQNQLIQSEKLASLGELTAGIAHEIQNPLNFVNNFSEVSVELIEELEAEVDNGDKDEIKAIASDIKQNLGKILHHGKRADNIVKGMLQHSRASSHVKEPVNINTLADEYLRLAYHGLRAKDKSFNAELVTDFADNLPLLNAVPQDLGRVLLNLFNNGFYSVQQKQKTADPGYKPTLTVTTRMVKTATGAESAAISVHDNGLGMSDAVKDKILQPFFTTKPTGEGTGLGLSISYDIVVKGHNGSIRVDSQEGEFAEIILLLPVV